MISSRNFPVVTRLARIALRRGGADAERAVAELAGQVRNEALRDDAPAPLRTLGYGQAQELMGMLDRHRRVRAPDDGGPTPEAKAKRKRDTIGALHKAGTLSLEQVAAAEHLYQAHAILATGLNFAQYRYRERTSRSGHGAATPDWTGSQIARVERYRKWCERMDEADLPVAPVMDIVTGTGGVRDAERAHRMRSGTLTEVLGEALALYVRMVGWK